MGEIGRNCLVLEYQDNILVIDAGIMFPSDDMPGVDLVIPDFQYLVERRDRVRGIIITHGHEDHIGGLPYLLSEVKAPVYATPLTRGLIEAKLRSRGLRDTADLHTLRPGDEVDLGPFQVTPFHVNHSIPDAVGFAIRTPVGLVMHTGDFKIDHTPLDGRPMDLGELAVFSSEGVRLLLSDSTNADQHGHSRSETSVGKVLQDLFAANAGRRIVTACFASHVHRVQQIADAAIAQGRVVATLGLSMKKNVRLAKEMGLLNIPDSKLLDIEDVRDMEPGKVCVISTGSQGEPMSALALMASAESKWLKLNEHDTVILSSHPIPGNEMNVSKVIDGLVRLGVKVVHSGIEDVHATGHAKQEELKTLLSVVRPEWFIPVHGEYRHLVAHAELARSMSISDDRILICEDGDRVSLGDKGLKRDGRVPAPYLFVDGIVGDVGHGVLRDRKVLAEEGVVVVVVTIDHDAAELVTGPEIITRGWVHAPEAEDLLDEARKTVADAVLAALEDGDAEIESIQRIVRRSTGKFVSDRTRRRPMIVPVVMSV